MKVELRYLNLQFKFEAGTSRGILRDKDSVYIILSEGDVQGIGECAPIYGLSIEEPKSLDIRIKEIVKSLDMLQDIPKSFEEVNILLDAMGLDFFPSIRFALETAFLDLFNGGRRIIFDNDFSKGNSLIPINGLIWMGDKQFMLNQVQEKIDTEFKCVKLKIGAIDFEQECGILSSIRERFDSDEMELRVDANGAFDPEDALDKLKKLASFKLHSIEQPISYRQYDEMKRLCRKSPIPIALDEDLIGISDYDDKKALLEYIRPQYIILKPMLLGGIKHCNEWIAIAEKLKIGWWMTSSLESNIGLNALAQYAYELNTTIPQGLGTGQLYENNIPSPLKVQGGYITYVPALEWDLSLLKLD